jgi:hypothetical protein
MSTQPAGAPTGPEPTQATAALPPPLTPPAEPERSVIETRPEILVGAAAAGGFLLAKILGRLRSS